MFPSAVAVWLHVYHRHCGWKFVLFLKVQNDHVDCKTSPEPTLRVFELSISDPCQTPTHRLQLSDIRGTAHYFFLVTDEGLSRSNTSKWTQLLLPRVLVTQWWATPRGPSLCPLSSRTGHLQSLYAAALLQFLLCCSIPCLRSACDGTTFASHFQWVTFCGNVIWKSKAERATVKSFTPRRSWWEARMVLAQT